VRSISDDLEIFVFTAANSTAQENLLKSIENPIQPESIIFNGFKEITEDLHDELIRIKSTAGGFYAWGGRATGSRSLHVGEDGSWRLCPSLLPQRLPLYCSGSHGHS
jgi:hypothetical protein